DKGRARRGIERFALEQVAQVGECVVVAGRWTMADRSREDAGRFYQVLRVRAGLIVDIQGCTSPRAAMAYAPRRARTACATSAGRLPHKRADSCLLGVGQLLQRVRVRP